MKKTALLFILMALMAGCAGIETQRAVVQENVFYSPWRPEVKLQVAQELKYIGEVSESMRIASGGGYTSIRSTTYLFGETGEENKLARVVMISVMNLPYDGTDSYWKFDVFQGLKDVLESGREQIGGSNYQCCYLASPLPLRKFEWEFLSSKGYRISDCYLGKHLGKVFGPDSKEKVYIRYLEDANDIRLQEGGKAFTCPDWNKPSFLWPESQNAHLAKVKQRSRTDLMVLDR